MRLLTITAVFSSLFYTTASYGYVDPQAGSIALQATLAAITGGFLAFKLFGQRIKAFFKGQKK